MKRNILVTSILILLLLCVNSRNGFIDQEEMNKIYEDYLEGFKEPIKQRNL